MSDVLEFAEALVSSAQHTSVDELIQGMVASTAASEGVRTDGVTSATSAARTPLQRPNTSELDDAGAARVGDASIRSAATGETGGGADASAPRAAKRRRQDSGAAAAVAGAPPQLGVTRFSRVETTAPSASNPPKLSVKVPVRGATSLRAAVNGTVVSVSTAPQPKAKLTAAQQGAAMGVALLEAVKQGHTARVSSLLRLGAAVDCRDALGHTALHWACGRASAEVALKLVETGAPVDARDEVGNTALHMAVASGSLPLVKALLDRGADVNVENAMHDRPLHWVAAFGDNVAIAKLLLSAKADALARNHKLHTAYQTALMQGHTKVAEFLRVAGAVPPRLPTATPHREVKLPVRLPELARRATRQKAQSQPEGVAPGATAPLSASTAAGHTTKEKSR